MLKTRTSNYHNIIAIGNNWTIKEESLLGRVFQNKTDWWAWEYRQHPKKKGKSQNRKHEADSFCIWVNPPKHFFANHYFEVSQGKNRLLPHAAPPPPPPPKSHAQVNPISIFYYYSYINCTPSFPTQKKKWKSSVCWWE